MEERVVETQNSRSSKQIRLQTETQQDECSSLGNFILIAYARDNLASDITSQFSDD